MSMTYKYEVTLRKGGIMFTVPYNPEDGEDGWMEALHHATSEILAIDPDADVEVLYVEEYDEYTDKIMKYEWGNYEVQT